MAVKRKGGLGKGLGALISTGEDESPVQEINQDSAQNEGTQKETPAQTKPSKSSSKQEKSTEKVKIIVDNSPKMVDIYEIEPDRDQPRHDFGQEELEELAASIRQYGILQPILVNNSEGYYKIIAGERRWRAAKLAGLEKVPILIKELTEEKAFEISLIENIQRQDLNPIEEALAYRRLMDEYHLTQEVVAERVGKSRSGIANSLRLLSLDPEVQVYVQDGSLSQGHAKVLSGQDGQAELARRCVEEGLSVRQLENLIKAKSRGTKPAKTEEVPRFQEVENKMRSVLGTKVHIQHGKRKGRIEIEYYSEEDLERLMLLISSIEGR